MTSPTPLHRCRIEWAEDAYLDIEYAKGSGSGFGSSFVQAPATLLLEREQDDRVLAEAPVPAICIRGAGDALFRQFQLREETSYFVDICVPISRAEAEERSKASPQWPMVGRIGDKFRREPVRRWKAGPNNSCIVTGSLNIRSYAGVMTLGIDGTAFSFEAEVACRKLNYFDEFKCLLTEIAEELAELLLQHEAPASIDFASSDKIGVLDTGALVLLRHIMATNNLPNAASRILARPHSRLRQISLVSEQPDAGSIALDAVHESTSQGQFYRGATFGRMFRGFVPSALPSEEFEETADTPENRLVLNFLVDLRHLCNRLALHLTETKRRSVTLECAGWVAQLDELLDADLWREVRALNSVPHSSQVMQRRDGYRDVLRYDLQLRMGLALQWDQSTVLEDGLRGDIRPVSELYEYWCYLTLRRVVQEICGGMLPGGNLLHTGADGFEVSLRRGHKSKARFQYKGAAARSLNISLYYNRRFTRPNSSATGWNGSYTTPFHPDFSLLIRRDGDEGVHWLHFDAKYRTNAEVFFNSASVDENEEDSENSEDGYVGEMIRAHRRDDLFKMHTYRDGILGSRGSYILFPGDTPDQVASHSVSVRHPSAFGGTRTFQVPSVGAFALTPGLSGSQIHAVSDFLHAVFDALVESGSYAEEYGIIPVA